MWIIALLIGVVFSVPVGFAQNAQYLLMEPIGSSVISGDFEPFLDICQDMLAVNIEPPFSFSGYMNKDKFIEQFSRKFADFQFLKMEWTSAQVGIDFAVQSLTLMLKNKRTERVVYYKLIFFMTKIEKEWKIYYLRGLRI